MTDGTLHPEPGRSDDHVSTDELSAQLDGELDSRRAGDIVVHLASCSACTEEHRRLLEVRTLLRELETSAPTAVRDAALAAALAAVTADPVPTALRLLHRRERRLRLVGIAASVVLTAGIAAGIGEAIAHRGSSSATSSPSSTTEQNSLHPAAGGTPAGKARSPAVGLRGLAGPGAGQLVAVLAPAEVTRVVLAPERDGHYGVTIFLAPGRSAISLLGDRSLAVVAVAGGERLGTARATSARTIEMVGLSRAQAIRLRALLG